MWATAGQWWLTPLSPAFSTGRWLSVSSRPPGLKREFQDSQGCLEKQKQQKACHCVWLKLVVLCCHHRLLLLIMRLQAVPTQQSVHRGHSSPLLLPGSWCLVRYHIMGLYSPGDCEDSPAPSPPAPPCSDQQSQVPRQESQETPVLTCNVLLPNPCPHLAAHSAFVQNSVHPQDVHLGLWDGPGPKSGSPLPPFSSMPRARSQLPQGAHSSELRLTPGAGCAGAQPLWGLGGGHSQTHSVVVNQLRVPIRIDC